MRKLKVSNGKFRKFDKKFDLNFVLESGLDGYEKDCVIGGLILIGLGVVFLGFKQRRSRYQSEDDCIC